jgi:hypothetical protein
MSVDTFLTGQKTAFVRLANRAFYGLIRDTVLAMTCIMHNGICGMPNPVKVQPQATPAQPPTRPFSSRDFCNTGENGGAPDSEISQKISNANRRVNQNFYVRQTLNTIIEVCSYNFPARSREDYGILFSRKIHYNVARDIRRGGSWDNIL